MIRRMHRLRVDELLVLFRLLRGRLVTAARDACGGPFEISPAIFSASRESVRAGGMNRRTAV